MEINPAIIPYAIPPFISAVVISAIGLFVYLKNPRSSTNRFFSFFMLACVIWQIGFGFMNMMKNENDAFLFSRIIYSAVVFIPSFYYSFAAHFLDLKKRFFLSKIALATSVIFLILLWSTNSFLSGNILYSWGYSSRASYIHTLFLIFFFAAFALSFYDLFKFYHSTKDSSPLLANRAKYVLASFTVALIASTDFLSTYSIDYYPLGFAFMIAFVAITSYAIVKYNLMDINVVFKKGFLYSISFTLISFAAALLLLAGEHMSQVYFGRSSFLFRFLSLIILSIFFIPINSFLVNRLAIFIFKQPIDKLLETNTQLMRDAINQEHLKSIATLAAGMAHEIKNPLTAIKTFAEYLPDKYQDPDFRDKFQKIVVDEVDRVNNIVRQLLEFSKPSEPVLKNESIQEILDDTLELLNNNLVSSNIQIIRNYERFPKIPADKNQLKQAFLNIFLNSIQAMPSGGSLTISTHARGHLLISIHDTGCGIPNENSKSIFDPFFTTKETGTGLGLSIVHGIIQEHGGKIEIKSEAGKGTTVNVFLNNRNSYIPSS